MAEAAGGGTRVLLGRASRRRLLRAFAAPAQHLPQQFEKHSPMLSAHWTARGPVGEAARGWAPCSAPLTVQTRVLLIRRRQLRINGRCGVLGFRHRASAPLRRRQGVDAGRPLVQGRGPVRPQRKHRRLPASLNLAAPVAAGLVIHIGARQTSIASKLVTLGTQTRQAA